MLLALVINVYSLENKLKTNSELINKQKIELIELYTRDVALDNANIMAIESSNKDAKIVEKKIVEIEKVYIPQIEYIDRYVGDVNATNCEKNVNGIITSFIY